MSMIDQRFIRLAEVLVDYSLKIKKNDNLVIRAKSTLPEPLIREVYRLAIQRGARVDIMMGFDGQDKILLDHAKEHQLSGPTLMEEALFTQYNKLLSIMGEANTRELTNVPASRARARMLGLKGVREKFFERTGSGKASWCGTQFPTYAAAQDGNMSFEEYLEFYFGACACVLDPKKPAVEHWKKVSAEQARMIAKLNKVTELRIVSEDTDLVLSVKGRKWQNCDGRQNFPDGEIFTSPVETSAEGHIRFSFPGIYMGREIEDIFLQFKKGKVIKATAKKGEDLLQELLKVDEGASFLGEVAIGTNYGIQKFTKNILFDEKIGGTVHLAIGAGFPEAGSKNKSTLHWDMICDMKKFGKIFADGKVIYEYGRPKGL